RVWGGACCVGRHDGVAGKVNLTLLVQNYAFLMIFCSFFAIFAAKWHFHGGKTGVCKPKWMP
ncbi:MAG: hypothetical protein II755_05225, partial [Prevotella sp.]|nr:hypothetical protein [Prevotella sp.]